MGIEEFLLARAKKEGVDLGREEGREEGMKLKTREKDTAFVRSLLLQSDFSTEKIAVLVGVPVEFVLKIKSEL